MTIADRRDSFCGKMSVCNNLQQYRIPYSLTTLHTEGAGFGGIHARHRVVRGGVPGGERAARLRIGAIGARPAAFNTVRYSEKMLEANGITIEPLDLSEVFGRIDRLKCDGRGRAGKDRAPSARTCSTDGVPDDAIVKMAKLGVVIDRWMRDNDLESARCSAGRRWRNTSAWCRAR